MEEEVGGMKGEEPSGLVGRKGVEDRAGGVDRLSSVVLLGARRGGEPVLEGAVQFPEVALGIFTRHNDGANRCAAVWRNRLSALLGD